MREQIRVSESTLAPLLLFLVAGSSWACSCPRLDNPMIAHDVSELAFVGTVAGLTDGTHFAVYRVEVDGVWKGTVFSQVLVLATDLCSPAIAVGERRYFFARRRLGVFADLSCMPSWLASSAPSAVALGAPGRPPSIGWLLLLLLGASAGLIFARRAKGRAKP